MAVIKEIENSILSLKTQIGTMSNGKPRYKTYSYSNVDTAASDENMHFVGKSLATLYQPIPSKITRQDICNLLEE